MNCPFCSSNLNKVVDKRAVAKSGEIRRRRECLKCGKRFTTYEKVVGLQVWVLKKDQRREIYSQEKLYAGILKALEKRPGIDRAQVLVDRIERRLRAKRFKEIPSNLLGKWVLMELKKVDPVAYLRFASVYHTFTTPYDFEKELQNL